MWPREQAFANRAETSPAWALDELAAMASAGGVPGAQPRRRRSTVRDAALRTRTPEERGRASGLFGKALAGHIKPWKDSSATERLDPRNGLAACSSHDVAFDTGMLTVSADLKIHVAQPLANAVRGDDLTRQYYGRSPLLDVLLLPDDAERPRRKYLDWHREKIFIA